MIWAGLAHDKFWTYMQYRWTVDKMKDPQVSLKRQEQNELIKYFNILGGTYILDLLSEDEIYEKTTKKLNKIFSVNEKSA